MHIRIKRTPTPVEETVEVHFPLFLHTYDYPDGGGEWHVWTRIDSDGSETRITRRSYGGRDNTEWTVDTDSINLENNLGRYLDSGTDHQRIELEEFSKVLAQLTLYVGQLPGAPPPSAGVRLGERAGGIPAILDRLHSGAGPDPRLDRDIKYAVLGLERANATPGIARVTASIDSALAFAVSAGSGSRNEVDILSDTLSRMSYAGYYQDRPIPHQIARYVMIDLLNDLLGDAEHEVSDLEDPGPSRMDTLSPL